MNKETPEEKPQPEEQAKKYFDEEQYNTVTVGAGETASPLKEADFVRTLLNLLDSGNPDDKDKALDLLKQENATDYLMEAIRQTANNDKKAVLLAACWETGLSFKGHHNFFLEYALNANPLISLEAITVIDTNREFIPREELQGLMDKLGEAISRNHDNAALLEDLKLALFEQLKEE